MIRVLVMANDSLLANHIVSTLSQEADLDVFRVTRDELGIRRDYAVVIVVDEEMDEHEPIRLREIVRDDSSLLLIRVSLKNRYVYVDESYQLANPGMGQMVKLVRDFNRKSQNNRSDAVLQKKMNEAPVMQTIKHSSQQVNFQAGDPVLLMAAQTPRQSRRYVTLPITT